MSVDWELVWSIILVATLIAFALLAVATTIGGALDWRRLFRRLDDGDAD